MTSELAWCTNCSRTDGHHADWCHRATGVGSQPPTPMQVLRREVGSLLLDQWESGFRVRFHGQTIRIERDHWLFEYAVTDQELARFSSTIAVEAVAVTLDQLADQAKQHWLPIMIAEAADGSWTADQPRPF